MDFLRADWQADLKDLKLDLIKWLGGTMIAVVGIAVAVLSLILGSWRRQQSGQSSSPTFPR